MKERIYICGYMGAGKSSLSKRLASKLGWTAFDLDDIFEEKYKIRVRDFLTNTTNLCLGNLKVPC